MLKILIQNNQKLRCPRKSITNKCQTILKLLKISKAELSILIVDNLQIKKLNKDYRKKNKETNVLSFPVNPTFKKLHNYILGDIVISLEKAKEEAIQKKITLNQRLSQLLIHSILHLLGHTHNNQDDKKIMEKKSYELLSQIEKKTKLSFF